MNISSITDDSQAYQLITPFDSLPQALLIESSKKSILGYKCQYAKYNFFSNTVEVWFTEKTQAKGSPYNRFLPKKEALVLAISVNGSTRLTAANIQQNKQLPVIAPVKDATTVNKAVFEELKINSRYTRLSVFQEQIINFEGDLKTSLDTSLATINRLSRGTVVLKKIKLSQAMQKSPYVFARLHCRSNGDAYDRTGSVFILHDQEGLEEGMLSAYQYGIDSLPSFQDNSGEQYQGISRTRDYAPPVELMRFFTSFGAEHFNNKRPIHNYPWAEDVLYEQDVSDLFPNTEEYVWIGVFIGNYDKGGHIISLDLDFHPGFDDSAESDKFILPLFNTVNTLEMSGQNYGKLFLNDTLRVPFEIKDAVEGLQLLFTSTGHGGWGGGDEFNPKLNQLFLNGKPLFSIVPWRTDCASYRFANPASGNFGNGLSSSDLSRSNWCPATLTPPYLIPLPTLTKGTHLLEVVIDQGEAEGNSHSAWNVSGVLVGKTIQQ